MMRSGPTRPYAIAAVLALALSACGGGNGAPGPEVGGGEGAEAYDKSHVIGIFDASPTLSHLATYSLDDQGSTLVELVESPDILDLRGEVPDDYELIQGGRFLGVPIGKTSSSASNSDGDAQITTLGGWLEYNYFEARMSGSFGSSLGDAADSALTYSIGAATGTNPTRGSATWKGASVGLDVRPNAAWSIVGEAVLTVDFSPYEHLPDTASVDIEINDLRRVAGTQVSYADLEFRGVPVFDGEFYDGPITALPIPDEMGNPNTELFHRDHVSGAFYGPNHEEVGGVYVVSPTEDYREQVIVGAFGAKRTD